MPPGRLHGEEPTYEVFISYRVASDSAIASALHYKLTKRGYKVFFDKVLFFQAIILAYIYVWQHQVCIGAGQDWEEVFLKGLLSSRLFVPIISSKGLYSGKNSRDLSVVTEESPSDSVMLEFALALELKDRNLIQEILPIVVGTDVSAARAQPVEIKQVTKKLDSFLVRFGLGKRRRTWTAHGAVETMLGSVDISSPPLDRESLSETSFHGVVRQLSRLKSPTFFEVLIAFRAESRDDKQQAKHLRGLLVKDGIRAKLAPFSKRSSALVALQPLVFIPIMSRASLLPLHGLRPDSPSDPVGVELAAAVHLKGTGALHFIFPILLGSLLSQSQQSQETAESTVGRGKFDFSWCAASDSVVEQSKADLEALLGAPPDDAVSNMSCLQLVSTITRNQGSKIDSNSTLEKVQNSFAFAFVSGLRATPTFFSAHFPYVYSGCRGYQTDDWPHHSQ